uniref:Ribosomal protein L22 n=1 Tax=Heterorhabditis bacteriophora TaxID=37862 RepID=A0A1I7WUF8_HETBA
MAIVAEHSIGRAREAIGNKINK